jgi:hypothetical protein
VVIGFSPLLNKNRKKVSPTRLKANEKSAIKRRTQASARIADIDAFKT